MRQHRWILSAAIAATITSGCGGQGTLAVQDTSAGAAPAAVDATDEAGAPDVAVGSAGELVVDGGQLPDGFPDDLPLPQGLTVNAGIASGASSYDVHGTIDGGSVAGVLDQLAADLSEDGWTPELLELEGSPVGLRALRGDGRYEIQITDLGEAPLLVMLQVRLP